MRAIHDHNSCVNMRVFSLRCWLPDVLRCAVLRLQWGCTQWSAMARTASHHGDEWPACSRPSRSTDQVIVWRQPVSV
eukprot:7664706-Pyramimonas_sp.AAC.1